MISNSKNKNNGDVISRDKIIPADISCRISALRFLLAVLVVFSHNRLDSVSAKVLNLDFSEPVIVTYLKYFIGTILGEAAVPLFFLFSAYLQFRKKDNYMQLLRKKCKSVLFPFIIWTLLYVLFNFIGQNMSKISMFISEIKVLEWNFGDWINIFWTYSDGKYPLVSQFWFLRDLIIMIIISPLIEIFGKKSPFLLFIVAFCSYFVGLPLRLGTALFFYVLGFLCAEYDINFFSLADTISFLDFTILFVIEILLRMLFKDSIRIFEFEVIISCLFFLKISKNIVNRPRIFNYCNNLSVYSFFLYAIHQPWLSPLKKISWKLIPLHGYLCLLQFILPSIITVMFGFLIGGFLKNLLPHLFELLNGGRK